MGAAVDHWQHIVGPGLEQDLLDAAEETAAHLLLEIRRDAAKAGDDWAEAADKAEIRRLSHNVVIEFPGEAHDLEYGTESKPPRAMVRANVGQMGKDLNGRFSNALGRRIFGHKEDL